MSHFIGNNRVTFDVEKILMVYWNCKDRQELTYVEVCLIGGYKVYLYFSFAEDFELINELRNYFGYDTLPRVK